MLQDGSGTSVITASAAGCNGPSTSNHTVTITALLGTRIYSGCNIYTLPGAGTVTYAATATNTPV